MVDNQFISQVKMGFLGVLPAIITFFIPAIPIISIVVILMMVDTYWGIKASKFEKKKITSNRFSDFFAKLLGYFIFIFIGLIIQKQFNLHYAVWLSALIPIYIEILSINENQKRVGKIGIIDRAENLYKVVLNIKKNRDKLR